MGWQWKVLWAACAKQDTLTKVQWKIIMRHQFPAFISSSSICMMYCSCCFVFLTVPRYQWKTSLDSWGVNKTSRITKCLICENESLSFLRVVTVHFWEMVLWELTLSSPTFLCWLYSFLLFPKVLLPAFHVMISLFCTHCRIVSMWCHTSLTALLWCLIGF